MLTAFTNVLKTVLKMQNKYVLLYFVLLLWPKPLRHKFTIFMRLLSCWSATFKSGFHLLIALQA